MLKKNYNKLVAAISAVSMAASFAAPLATAEETVNVSSEEMATLAAGSAIIKNNFDSLSEGSLIHLTTKDQDAYSEIDGINIHIGKASAKLGEDETTNASIVSGAGVDGSNALALKIGEKGNTQLYTPRISFEVPEVEDNYMISFKLYPCDLQEGNISDSPTDAKGTALNLVTGEWNDVEIYVTRSGRIVNVNNVTVLDDDTTTVPVLWGRIGTKGIENSGSLYMDDFAVTSVTALPTAIPTPTPEPPYQPKIGDVFDFEDVAAGSLVFLNTSATPTYTALNGFKLDVASRSNGSAAETKIAIAEGKGVDNSKALQLNYATFADTSRGPRITLVEPKESEYVVTFKAKSDGTQDIVVAGDASTNSGAELDIKSEEWSTVEIYMFDEQRLILCDGRFISLVTTNDLPVLWGLNSNNSGSFYIDDYSISDISEQGVTDAMAATLDITNEDKTVYLDSEGKYDFIQGFALADTACGESVTWAAYESTDGGNTWADTADVRATKTAFSVTSAVSTEKLYKLVGTVNNNGLTASKEFVLQYVESSDVLDVVLGDLDITSDMYKAEVEKKEVTNEDGTKEYKYIIRGDFAVSESEWVSSITWESSDSSLVKVGAMGSILVYPKKGETVTLTATASYNGQSKTKDFKLDLANYYTTVYRLVDTELSNVELAPKGTDGEKVTKVVLDSDNETKITYDLALDTSSSTKGVKIKWETSNDKVLTSDGVINVDNTDANKVKLTKIVTYSINGVEVYSAEKEYALNVEFEPTAVKKEAVKLATAYAVANGANADSVEDSTAYNVAMEMLYDRYVTRFDANCKDNFEDVPSKVTSDFELPTEGVFGSKITWASSITNIEINNKGKADVTRSSSDKKGKLTATFTCGASVNADAKEFSITVSGKGGLSAGGGGNHSSQTGGGNAYLGSIGVVGSTTPSSDNDITTVAEFADLDQASWAAVAIMDLANKGIVSGRTTTEFAPNDSITRAEFAKILVGAFNLPIITASAGFADVADDAWYAPYVNTCYSAGIITGYDNTTFGPNDLVTRQDMAVMVMRAVSLKGLTVEIVNEKIDFADADEIGEYAVEAVSALQQGGVINGMTENTFAPTETATRAQAAKILHSFCN